MTIKNKIIFSVGVILTAFIADTAGAYTYIPLEAIPGTGTAVDFPSYILAIYKFAVWTVGIAALMMMTIGGFMYFTAAGNNASMEKAKTVIADSVYGVLAVLLAYLILYVINPDLVNIDLSSLNVIRGEITPPP